MKTAHGKKHAKDKSFQTEVFENRHTCVVQSRHKHCDSAARCMLRQIKEMQKGKENSPTTSKHYALTRRHNEETQG